MNTCDGFDFRIEVRPWRETAYIALVHVVRHDSAKRTVVLPWPDGALSPNFFATPAEAEVACRTSVSLMKQSGEASTWPAVNGGVSSSRPSVLSAYWTSCMAIASTLPAGK